MANLEAAPSAAVGHLQAMGLQLQKRLVAGQFLSRVPTWWQRQACCGICLDFFDQFLHSGLSLIAKHGQRKRTSVARPGYRQPWPGHLKTGEASKTTKNSLHFY